MKPIDVQACENLAFCWCIENMPWHPDPRQWKKEHWMLFLDELDTRTGEMWLTIFKRERERRHDAGPEH